MGQRMLRTNTSQVGRPPKIKTDSAEAQIVADCIEDGLSLNLTTLLLNEHMRQQGKEPYSFSAVYSVSK